MSAKLTEIFVLKENEQTNDKVEKLLSSSDISAFTDLDWRDLALVCVDRANLPGPHQKKIEDLLRSLKRI